MNKSVNKNNINSEATLLSSINWPWLMISNYPIEIERSSFQKRMTCIWRRLHKDFYKKSKKSVWKLWIKYDSVTVKALIFSINSMRSIRSHRDSETLSLIGWLIHKETWRSRNRRVRRKDRIFVWESKWVHLIGSNLSKKCSGKNFRWFRRLFMTSKR